jgi:hypothetical protein
LISNVLIYYLFFWKKFWRLANIKKWQLLKIFAIHHRNEAKNYYRNIFQSNHLWVSRFFWEDRNDLVFKKRKFAICEGISLSELSSKFPLQSIEKAKIDLLTWFKSNQVKDQHISNIDLTYPSYLFHLVSDTVHMSLKVHGPWNSSSHFYQTLKRFQYYFIIVFILYNLILWFIQILHLTTGFINISNHLKNHPFFKQFRVSVNYQQDKQCCSCQ